VALEGWFPCGACGGVRVLLADRSRSAHLTVGERAVIKVVGI
jgi:hypothetical protein